MELKDGGALWPAISEWGPDALKQGGKDIPEVLKPVKKVDLGDEAKQVSSFCDGAAADDVLCDVGGRRRVPLRLCGTLTEGLNSANGDFDETDQAIRDSVSSVKKVLV